MDSWTAGQTDDLDRRRDGWRDRGHRLGVPFLLGRGFSVLVRCEIDDLVIRIE